MNYNNLEENPAFNAGKEFGKLTAIQLNHHPIKKREFYMYENKVFINDCYVTFNIIELNREEGKITVNICCQGHHTTDTFELYEIGRAHV